MRTARNRLLVPAIYALAVAILMAHAVGIEVSEQPAPQPHGATKATSATDWGTRNVTSGDSLNLGFRR